MHGTAKLARRVLVPVNAKVVLEVMDEPKRLHRKQQASQEKSDETAALEHEIEIGADGRKAPSMPHCPGRLGNRL